VNTSIEYFVDRASEDQIAEHLARCDEDFVPPLSRRYNINDYARKIAEKAVRFEAWSEGVLIGLAAAYCNDQQYRIAYLTSVSVLGPWKRKGIAARLLEGCFQHAKTSGMTRIDLEVARADPRAIALYEKSGFVAGERKGPTIPMSLKFQHKDEHE